MYSEHLNVTFDFHGFSLNGETLFKPREFKGQMEGRPRGEFALSPLIIH